MSTAKRTDTETLVLIDAMLTTEEWNTDLFAGIESYVSEQVQAIDPTEYSLILQAHHSEAAKDTHCPQCGYLTMIEKGGDEYGCARCGWNGDICGHD